MMMDRPETYIEKKNWLRNHFGRPVRTEAQGLEFVSSINLEISNGIIGSAASAKGSTEAESISNLFAEIVNHGPRNHIVCPNGDLNRLSINPHTLEITPCAA